MHRLDLVLRARPRGYQLVKLVVMFEAAEDVGEPLVGRPFWMARGGAEGPPFGVVADGDHQPVVFTGAWVAALRGVPMATVADSCGVAAVEGVVHQRVAGHRNRRFVFRQLD